MTGADIPVHRTKVELAYAFLRERILNGTLAPGERVTLAQLSQLMGTSQMPIREAMLRLQQEGLVDIAPHASMRIARLEPEDVAELFAVRAALEGLAARQACSRLGTEGVAALAALNARFAECQRAGDYTGMADANWQFHRLILRTARNAQLARLLEDIWDKCFRFRAGYRLIPGRSGSTVDEHAAIIAAFRAGNEEVAAAAAFAHVQAGGAELVRTLKVAS